MITREIRSKTILSASKIYDYVINPYVGCSHGCSYCYARFIKKFTEHSEPWGEFVDIRVNAAELLEVEIRKKKPGRVWVSGLCDPFQPLEEQYAITRKCLEILIRHNWLVVIQTRSPLVLRDLDILMKATSLEAGLSVTTADDRIRQLFEPSAPAVEARIHALDVLHGSGIRTYAMIAPLLPGAERLPELLAGKVDYVLIDRMNYHYADWLYHKHGMDAWLSDGYFRQAGKELADAFSRKRISCRLVY